MIGLPFFKLPFLNAQKTAEPVSYEELEKGFIKYLRGLGIGPEEIESAYAYFSNPGGKRPENPKVWDIVREMNKLSQKGFQVDRFMEMVAEAKNN